MIVERNRFFTCSYCGFQVKDWQAYYTTIDIVDGNTEHNDTYYNFQFRYCPKCGHQCEERKVLYKNPTEWEEI